MPSRRRPLLLVLGLVLTLLAGCSGSAATERTPGDPVSRDEAAVLAELLHRDFERGGADFVETAPYGDGTVLTLTGEVDFARSIGRARAVTTYPAGRPTETRTLFFTPQAIWFGDVPGLADALTAAGLPQAGYVRRNVGAASGTASLVDVLVQLLFRLSARSGDDPRSFLSGAYTWQGQRSVDGRPASVYALSGGKTVAVGVSDRLLLEYVKPLPDQDFQVTITLADHGPRQIQLPGDEETVDAAQHPQIAQQLGV